MSSTVREETAAEPQSSALGLELVRPSAPVCRGSVGGNRFGCGCEDVKLAWPPERRVAVEENK